MKKYRKKIALILVLALTLAVAIPALAGTTTEITGVYEEPTIEIQIPQVGSAVINPYKLPVTIKTDDGNDYATQLNNVGQIATRPLVGANMGEMPLKIGASISAVPTGDFILSAAAPANNAVTKSGQIFFEMSNPTIDGTTNKPYDLGLDTTLTEETLQTSTTTVCAGFDAAKVLTALEQWPLPTAYNAAQHVLLGYAANSKTDMVRLAPTTSGAAPVVADAHNNSGYFMARLCGNIVKLPMEEWNVADGFSATVTWIIEPDDAYTP